MHDDVSGVAVGLMMLELLFASVGLEAKSLAMAAASHTQFVVSVVFADVACHHGAGVVCSSAPL